MHEEDHAGNGHGPEGQSGNSHRIVTFLWRSPTMFHGRSYGAEEVNRLFGMIDRHISVPYEPVCICDDPKGIDEHIRTIPLWNDLRDWGSCYCRLKLYAPEMKELIGPRFMMIDVDTVVMGDMASLLNRGEDFIAYRCPSGAAIYSGGIVMMNAGCRSQVWKRIPDEIPETRYSGSDQAWISKALPKNEATFGPEHGVYYQRNYSGQDNAIIVFFSGTADPRFPPWSEKPWVKKHYR